MNAHRHRSTQHKSRHTPAGFTLVEVVIIVTIVAGLALLAAPKFTTIQDRSSLRSARQRIDAMVATARAAAIQKGRPARVAIRGNTAAVVATVNDAGATTNVGAPVPLDSLYGVVVALAGSADTAVIFDPRGFASPRLAGTLVYRFTKGGRTDSTCVSRVGQLL
jgi:Tfp pilus assembly protein FimT